jgi:hypothetical protein
VLDAAQKMKPAASAPNEVSARQPSTVAGGGN